MGMRFGYAFCRMSAQILLRLLYGMKVVGLNNIPPTGRIIVACNHRSNLDPPIVGSLVRREVAFFAKSELFEIPVLARLISYLNAFPVRRGEFDRKSLDVCLNVLKREGALVFFPEGTRAPAGGFLRAKLGVGWVIALSDSPVCPIYIDGSTHTRARLRGRPGITVVVGKPIPVEKLKPSEGRGRELYQEISDRVVEALRDLSLQSPLGRVTSKGPVHERSVIEDERLR